VRIVDRKGGWSDRHISDHKARVHAKSIVASVYVSIQLIQKRIAPTRPKRLAMPKVDAEEPTVAALVLLEVLLLLLLLAVVEAEPECVIVALAAAEELPPPVAELEPDPLSLMAVLTQLTSEPEIIVAWAEKAWVPVLSLRAAMKMVLAWRSTVQEKEVPVC